MTTDPDLLTLSAAADLCGVAQTTVTRAVERGYIARVPLPEGYKRPGKKGGRGKRTFLVPRADVLAWGAARAQRLAAQAEAAAKNL